MIDDRLPGQLRPAWRVLRRTVYGPIAGLAAVLTWATVASGIILLAAHFVAVLNSPIASRSPMSTSCQGRWPRVAVPSQAPL